MFGYLHDPSFFQSLACHHQCAFSVNKKHVSHFFRRRICCRTVWTYPCKAGMWVCEEDTTRWRWIIIFWFTYCTWKVCPMHYVQDKNSKHYIKTSERFSGTALLILLERRHGSNMERNTAISSEELTEVCTVCEKITTALRRVRLTVGAASLKFNQRVQVDTMFISGRPVIHMIDEVTHFCAGSVFQVQSTKIIWKQNWHISSLVYLRLQSFQ